MARVQVNRGFTLIEAAVAIGVLAILAGMMAPMGIRVLNREREESTRKSLKLAFEHMFGSRDMEIPNMRSDFGFTPMANMTNLSIMIDKTSITGGVDITNVPEWGRHGGSVYYWGYHGPYWQGTVVAGNPVDAWGRPLMLDVIAPPQAAPGDHVAAGRALVGENVQVQIRSLGSSGIYGAQDNLVYPPQHLDLGAYNCRILVRIGRRNGNGQNLTGMIRIQIPGNNQGLMRSSGTFTFGNLERTEVIDGSEYFVRTFPFAVTPGPAQIQISSIPGLGGNFTPRFIPIYLKPGENQMIKVLL